MIEEIIEMLALKHSDRLYWALKLGKLRGATLVFTTNNFNASWKKESVEKFVEEGYVTIDAGEVTHFYELAKECNEYEDIDDEHEFVMSQILEAAANKLAMREYLKLLK